MVEHLISLGHKRIAIMTEGSDTPSIVRLRLTGYLDALKKHGIKVNEKLIRPVEKKIYTVQNGYDTAKALIESGEKFTALYCISDVLAVGALRAFADAGIRVPEDVSVAGYDGQELAQYSVPRLTTIKQPADEIAKEATKLLFNIIDKESDHRHIVFPGELILGESAKKI